MVECSLFIKNLCYIFKCKCNRRNRSRSFKLQSIDRLFEPSKFEKVKGSNVVKCVQKKYFSYLIDKIVSLRRNFSKTYPFLFFINVFVIIFIKSIYQPCILYWSFSKSAFSHLYCINIWKFHISMVNMKQMVWAPMKCHKIFLIYVTWAK